MIVTSLESVWQVHPHNDKKGSFDLKTAEEHDHHSHDHKSEVSEKKKELEDERILKRFKLCFEKLNYKEKFVFKYRLIPGKYKTLKEIGILLNLSTQRIWQIENGALKKFRSSAKN